MAWPAHHAPRAYRCICCFLLLALLPHAAAAEYGDIGNPMYRDPVLLDPPLQRVFHPRYVELMSMALQRPDTETRRRAADSIGRLASEGMPGLRTLAPPLRTLLVDKSLRPALRLAAARALVRLEVQEAAGDLLQAASEAGTDMVLLVDGALAAWDHEPARATWTSRAANATEPRPHRISALRALATVGHREAAATLATIALDRAADPALRLEAATAAGRLAAEELEDDARTMLDGDLDDRMVAVRLLGTHESKEAVVLLRRLGTDREPAVAYGALRRLVDIDPALIEDFVPALCVQPTLSETHGTGLANLRFVADDPKIRALAAEALVFQRTPDSINLLAPMLDDAHVDVRTYVRRQLVAHDAQPPLRAAIRRAVTRILHLDEVDHWQGVEQAALLLGAIDHEQVAPRLLKLMPAARAEVRVAANVALRRLAIPQTLDEVYQMAERICFGLSKKYPSSGTSPLEPLDEDKQAQLISDTNKNVSMVALDAQVSQMMQMFCLMDYRPAEPLMRRHIPKHSFGEAARAAAIWALGHFYADKADEQLGGLFVGRLSDLTPLDPELPKVRRFSAISIGRMKAAQCASALQGFYESESFSDDIGGSCRWALTQIDGQQRPPLPTRLRTVTGFFIDPADKLERDEYLPAVKEPQ